MSVLYILIKTSMDKHSHNIVYAAIAASTIVSLVGTYLMVQQPQIDQVGGRENYKLYKEMINHPGFASRNKEGIEGQLAILNGKQAPQNNQQPSAEEPKTTGNLTQDDIAAITKDTYIKGNKDAQILWIEYSDLECPFCKRLHDSGAIKNMETKYGNKLAVSFKHYPLPFHPTALPAAQAAECVGELGGSDKYFAFVE